MTRWLAHRAAERDPYGAEREHEPQSRVVRPAPQESSRGLLWRPPRALETLLPQLPALAPPPEPPPQFSRACKDGRGER